MKLIKGKIETHIAYDDETTLCSIRPKNTTVIQGTIEDVTCTHCRKTNQIFNKDKVKSPQ